MNTQEITPVSPELQMLLNNKESGYNYRRRRQQDWLENYTLYRDKVTINRLTQRQSVNIPLMKQTVRTLLKDVDDMPVLFFENLDNDKTAEVFQNEYWKWTIEENSMELQDIMDKRQVFLFGRSFDQWQIEDGMIKVEIQDPQDMLVSRYCNPVDIDTSRFLIHMHIFKPLSDLEKNKDYDQKKVKELKTWYASEMGLVKANDNKNALTVKNEKMAAMGLSDVDSPILGETIVELTMHFVYRQEEGDDEEQLYQYVEADGMKILMKKPLDEVIGKTETDYWKNHYNYASWGDDLERQDFWSDSVADIIRTPNKVLNSWFSQLVENRTLRNYGMHYYDTTAAGDGFTPNTFNPVPWGWYGVPGKPSEIMQKVDIPDLSESLDELQFIITMAEKATGATATQQGVQTDRQVTLGEVQLALGEAKERVKGMSKFYTPAWKRRGKIFLKLIEAGADKLDAIKIYKEGRNTSDIFEREISPKDWMTKLGYRVKIWSQDEKDANDSETLQKVTAAVTMMPGNLKLLEIQQRKLLEFADLTPDEINAVMEQEQQKIDAMIQQQQQQNEMMQQQAQPQVQPQAQQPIQPAPAPVKKPKEKSKSNGKSVTKLKSLKNQIKENG